MIANWQRLAYQLFCRQSTCIVHNIYVHLSAGIYLQVSSHFWIDWVDGAKRILGRHVHIHVRDLLTRLRVHHEFNLVASHQECCVWHTDPNSMDLIPRDTIWWTPGWSKSSSVDLNGDYNGHIMRLLYCQLAMHMVCVVRQNSQAIVQGVIAQTNLWRR